MSETSKHELVYGIDERPPLGRSIIYGFQHIFAMILGSITGAVIIGKAIGLSSEQIGQLISYINFAVGIATILQVSVGVKLPIIQGSTSGHLPAYLALGSAGVALYKDPTLTMQYLGGALLVGALFEMAFGYLNILKYISKWISPITVGIVVAMVGLGLWPVVNDFIGSGWAYSIAIISIVLLFSFAFGKMMKTMALFGAVIVAYAIALLGTFLGWFTEGHHLFVDIGKIASGPWIRLPEVFPWGPPKFNAGFIFAMTIPYIATALESFGDYIAVAESSNVKTPTIKRISRGIGTEGLASAISSALGGTASSSFSQNVGVVRLSGVASRFVCIVAGVLLLIIGIIGKLGNFLAEIPRVILGSVYLTAFGILVMTGFRLIMKAQVTASRNEILIGTSLLIGLALPAYMKENPMEVQNSSLQVFLNVFLATPMMVSGVWAFILDNILPGSDEERGLINWLGKNSAKASCIAGLSIFLLAPPMASAQENQTAKAGFIDFNYYYDSRDFTGATLNLLASLPNNFEYFSLANYDGVANSPQAEETSLFYTEQNLRWYLNHDSPFAVSSQWVAQSGNKNDLLRSGLLIAFSKIKRFDRFFDGAANNFGINIFPIQFDQTPGYDWQIEYFYRLQLFERYFNDRLYLSGFADQNIDRSSKFTWVTEHQIGIRLLGRLHAVAEFRHNDYLASEKNGIGFGAQYVMNW